MSDPTSVQAEYAASSHRRAGRHAIAFGPIAQRMPHARATPTLGAAAWSTDKLGVLFEELPGMDGWIAVPPAVDLDGDGQGDLALFVRPRCSDAPLARDCYEVRRRAGTRIELVHAYRWSSVLQL